MADFKKIQYTDLVEKDAIPMLIAQLERTEKQMIEVSKAMKKIVEESANLAKQTPLQGYDNLQKVQEETDKVTKAVNTLRDAEVKRKKVLTEKQKLEKRLSDLRKAEAKEIAKLRAEINAQNKALRDEAKASLEASNGYKDLTKATNEAQANFKKLAAEQGINSKATQEAFKEFDKLDKKLREINDTARDGRRDVGRYRIATEKLGASMKALQAIGIIGILSKIGEFFGSNAEGGAALQKVIGRLTITLQVFVKRAVALIPLATQSFNNLVISIKIAIKQGQLFAAEFPEALGGSEEKAKALTAEIKALEAQTKAGGITIDAITKSFEGMGDEISKLIDKNDKFVDATLHSRKAILEEEEAIGSLLVERAKLQAQADDDTKSLASQIRAFEELAKVEEDIAQREIDIATKRLKLATDAAEIDSGSIAKREEQAQAFVALEEAKANAEEIRLENERQRRVAEIDLLEANVDILRDVSDRRKAIAEESLRDETKLYEDRAKGIVNSQKDINDTFREGIRLIEEQQGVRIDFDKLISTEDTKELLEYVNALGLAERPQNRLREIIIERLQATRDLKVAENDLLKIEEERARLNTDISAQEEALQDLQIEGIDINRVLEILQEKRTKNEIENLEFRLSKAKEGSEEYLKIEQELNNKLLDEAKRQADKQAKIEEAKQAKRIKTTEAAFAFIDNLADSINERRLAQFDRSIEESAQRESELSELAKNGSEQALQTLEFERKRQAELAQQREKEIESQAREELKLAGIKVFTESVASGDSIQEALSKSATALVALPALVNSLPAFKDGTMDTGKGGNWDAYGGFPALIHPNELIIPSEGQKIIPKSIKSPMEVAINARENVMRKESARPDNSRVIVDGLRNVERAIANKPVITDRVLDSVAEEVVTTIKRQGRIERRHRKLSILG